MRETFEKALTFTLQWEGYKSEDLDDPGGKTIFGISERFYPEEVARMWDMPKSQATAIAGEIYLEKYWIPIGCDNIEFPMDIIAFDTGVNMGISVARNLVKQSTSPFDYLMKRIKRYCAMNNFKYLRGWINRVINLYEEVIS